MDLRKKQNLKYVFHNPNTPEETEKFLTKWLVEINLPKLERMISEQALKNADKSNEKEVCDYGVSNNSTECLKGLVLQVGEGDNNYDAREDKIQRRYEAEMQVIEISPKSQLNLGQHR